MATLNTLVTSSPLSPPRQGFLATPAPATGIKDSVVETIELCSSIKQLKQVHGRMLRTGLFFDSYSASKLIAGAVSPTPSCSLDYARQVFDQIPEPNLYTWNILIRSYASGPDPARALQLFLRMLHQCPDQPNKFTFPFAIKAASALAATDIGKVLHGMAIKGSFGSDVFILNTLIYLYSVCGDLDAAYRIFQGIPERDVVSWNSMIKGFAHSDCPEQAMELFRAMEAEDTRPNGVTMVGVLSACAKKQDLEFGSCVHSRVERSGVGEDLTLNNAMLDMYTKCGSFEAAMTLFDKMAERDIVSWTTMIVGHAKSGNFEEALRLFDANPFPEIAAWNALISAFEQSGKPKEALAMFRELLDQHLMPDSFTLVSTLSACSQLGAIQLGGWIHGYIKQQGMEVTPHLGSSLIDMYSKCGDLEKALEVFHQIPRKDVFVWSAMIAGFAMHSRGRDAIDTFFQMQDEKITPTCVTFTNLLSACSHVGLVEEGRLLFDQMQTVYGIVPEPQHYASLVDVLGRAGLLEEAMGFIERMPVAPTSSVYGALLGACGIHGNLDLAEQIGDRLLELEPSNHGAIVLLSNIYAKKGRWGKVSGLRKMMRDQRMKKQPGRSSMEVDGVVHEFLAGDNAHPRAKDVYSKLNEMASRLKSVGYVPDMSQVLQLVEEDDAKEHALYLHSEKLAIAFGVVSVVSPGPIRIMKNLRVCGDCHTFAKLVSKVYDREIILRDRYRFHHFRGGDCTCKDYW